MPNFRSNFDSDSSDSSSDSDYDNIFLFVQTQNIHPFNQIQNNRNIRGHMRQIRRIPRFNPLLNQSNNPQMDILHPFTRIRQNFPQELPQEFFPDLPQMNFGPFSEMNHMLPPEIHQHLHQANVDPFHHMNHHMIPPEIRVRIYPDHLDAQNIHHSYQQIIHNLIQRRQGQPQNRNIYDYPEPNRHVDIEEIKRLLEYDTNTFKLDDSEEDKICPVMHEPIREGYKTKCNHYLSHEAIEGWIKEGKNTCPVCRSKLF